MNFEQSWGKWKRNWQIVKHSTTCLLSKWMKWMWNYRINRRLVLFSCKHMHKWVSIYKKKNMSHYIAKYHLRFESWQSNGSDIYAYVCSHFFFLMLTRELRDLFIKMMSNTTITLVILCFWKNYGDPSLSSWIILWYDL